MPVMCAGQKPINASRFGINMGGISFTRNGVTGHITNEGELLNDRQAQICDSCFEPFNRIDMIKIVDRMFHLCRMCYLKHISK
jgi:hypothetical protein